MIEAAEGRRTPSGGESRWRAQEHGSHSSLSSWRVVPSGFSRRVPDTGCWRCSGGLRCGNSADDRVTGAVSASSADPHPNPWRAGGSDPRRRWLRAEGETSDGGPFGTVRPVRPRSDASPSPGRGRRPARPRPDGRNRRSATEHLRPTASTGRSGSMRESSPRGSQGDGRGSALDVLAIVHCATDPRECGREPQGSRHGHCACIAAWH